MRRSAAVRDRELKRRIQTEKLLEAFREPSAKASPKHLWSSGPRKPSLDQARDAAWKSLPTKRDASRSTFHMPVFLGDLRTIASLMIARLYFLLPPGCIVQPTRELRSFARFADPA
jgi:hypothetical protein